jgi:hypothetical protein
MRRKLLALVCGAAAMLGAGSSMASVDDARTAIRIASQLCAHVGGLQPMHGFHWQAQRIGDAWKVWTMERGDADMVMLIPRHGPAPARCNSRIMD